MIFFKILLLVIFVVVDIGQGRHLLIETEDNKGELNEQEADSINLSSDMNILSKKEESAILDAFESKAVKEAYAKMKDSEKGIFQRKIRSSFGEDIEAMVEAAKDGTLLHLVGNAEECPPCLPLIAAVVSGTVGGAVSTGISAASKKCFASSSTVQTPNGVININSLRLNDSVLTFTPGVGAHYTEFLGWLDRSTESPSIFLEVVTAHSGPITLTASHVIFRFSKADTSLESLYASQIVVGDKLALFNDGGDMLQPEEVLEVKEVVEAGAWAPLTTSGTLLVDGFLASCYASFPHDYSELAYAPVKMFPKFLLDDQYSQHKDGVREVVKMIKKAGETLGLRRKVEEEGVEKPRFTARAINTLAATFGKHAEF